DVVMMLRVQLERQETSLFPSTREYFKRYGLTAARLARARPEAVVMHPGPMNRGVEIASDVADSDRSLILEQVSNGVAIRMAVLYLLLPGPAWGGEAAGGSPPLGGPPAAAQGRPGRGPRRRPRRRLRCPPRGRPGGGVR